MSMFELILIGLVLLFGASIIWSTVAVGISPMPSSKKARQAMMELIESVEPDIEEGAIIDLGSGWGSLVIPLARRYPHRQVVGYEVSLVPWLVTLLMGKLLGIKNLTVSRKNFLTADLSSASILVCYLFSSSMASLESKLLESNRGKQYLFSNNFAMPTLKADKMVKINDFYQSPIYQYRIN